MSVEPAEEPHEAAVEPLQYFGLSTYAAKTFVGLASLGVSINLGRVSDVVQASIEGDIPGAEMFESLWVWSDTPAGRLMVVDNQQTLASALVNGLVASTGSRSEIAIWGTGESNSLLVVLKAIFTWRLHRSNEEL